MRLTARDYYGNAYVPGYAPKCCDEETCRLLVEVTERLAQFEDEQEEQEGDAID